MNIVSSYIQYTTKTTATISNDINYQWYSITIAHGSGMSFTVAQCTCSCKLLTTFTLCSHTSELCCTTEVHSMNSYCRGCGQVVHKIHKLCHKDLPQLHCLHECECMYMCWGHIIHTYIMCMHKQHSQSCMYMCTCTCTHVHVGHIHIHNACMYYYIVIGSIGATLSKSAPECPI